jgi:acetolactate synthase-1/2/3 large subunit
MSMLRGADILARALGLAGLGTVYTLSGNHIMAVFDAAIGAGLELIHVRHEAAAIHMADAHARLTGACGVALVTGGPGHANAVGALYTALAAESPVILLSGHAGEGEIGRGAFQEMDQVALARPLVKAAWRAASAAGLGHDLARAVRIATAGRPGPVHVSLPVDHLDAKVADEPGLQPSPGDHREPPRALAEPSARALVAMIAGAERPLILAGPQLGSRPGRSALERLAAGLGAPAAVMESPRGINDPALGAFAEVLAQADLLVLLAKPLDFTLRFAAAPHVDARCRLAMVEPDAALVARAHREAGERIALAVEADAGPAIEALLAAAPTPRAPTLWQREVAAALALRPTVEGASRPSGGRLHPREVCAALAPVLAGDPDSILVSDGGEFGQWAQCLLSAPRRLVNGVAGAIGSAIPFAIAARRVEPRAPVVALLGDGTFGFHMAEFDTAVRARLPFLAVVGNDAAWNAEHQIQLRSYGADRTHGCELLPTRYGDVARALGGFGERVERIEDLAPAIARALASGLPACLDVQIERAAAPLVRRAPG